MEIYDTVRQLSKEIRESEEYEKYKKFKDLVKEAPELKERLDNFEKARYNTQLATMKGEEPTQEQIKNLHTIYLELIENDMTKEYLDAELKFNMMLADINNILRDAVKDVIE